MFTILKEWLSQRGVVNESEYLGKMKVLGLSILSISIVGVLQLEVASANLYTFAIVSALVSIFSGLSGLMLYGFGGLLFGFYSSPLGALFGVIMVLLTWSVHALQIRRLRDAKLTKYNILWPLLPIPPIFGTLFGIGLLTYKLTRPTKLDVQEVVTPMPIYAPTTTDVPSVQRRTKFAGLLKGGLTTVIIILILLWIVLSLVDTEPDVQSSVLQPVVPAVTDQTLFDISEETALRSSGQDAINTEPESSTLSVFNGVGFTFSLPAQWTGTSTSADVYPFSSDLQVFRSSDFEYQLHKPDCVATSSSWCDWTRTIVRGIELSFEKPVDTSSQLNDADNFRKFISDTNCYSQEKCEELVIDSKVAFFSSSNTISQSTIRVVHNSKLHTFKFEYADAVTEEEKMTIINDFIDSFHFTE